MTDGHCINVWKVFAGLVALTVLEIAVVYMSLPKALLATALIGSALAKAALVAVYFMHLKFERYRIWSMLVGTCVLAAVFLLGLFPDIVVGHWQR